MVTSRSAAAERDSLDPFDHGDSSHHAGSQRLEFGLGDRHAISIAPKKYPPRRFPAALTLVSTTQGSSGTPN
jgi:hypothetical protein